MVVGGVDSDGNLVQENELVSLDPANHPVPECLRNLTQFYLPVRQGTGGLVYGGRICSKIQ